MITKEQKAQAIAKFGNSDTNTGSTHVQVALLTLRINDLQDHFKANPKDHASRRGLLKMVSTRASLLKYVSNKDVDRYRSIISRLGLRK